MKGKEALKHIERSLADGKTKKEIYEELSGQITFRTDLLNLLAMVPEYDKRIKYRKINLILFFLIATVSTLKIVESSLFFLSISKYMLPLVLLVSFIPVVFAIMVWNFRGNIYRPLGLLCIAGILEGFAKTDLFLHQSWDWSLGYTLSLAIMSLAYFIGFKAFPYYGFWGMLKEKEFKESLMA